MLHKWSLALGILLLAGNVQSAQFQTVLAKNIERVVLQEVQAKNSYPGLSKEQSEQIPFLLTLAAEQAYRAYPELGELTPQDVVANLRFYLGGGYNPLEARATTDEERARASQFSKKDLEHALHDALVLVVAPRYRTFLKNSDYPRVKNKEQFDALCQAFMDDFYEVLSKDLATGNKSAIEEVFLVDPD